MVEQKPSRASTAIGLCLAVLAAALGFAWTDRAGADVDPVGAVSMTLVGGEIVIAGGAVLPPIALGPCDPVDPECDPSAPPTSLQGTVDVDGKLTIPAANVVFPPLDVTDPLPVHVTIAAAKDVTGVIDPAAGTVSMDLELAVNLDIEVFSALCAISLPMHLTGSYDEVTGVADVTDSTFAIPGLSCNNPVHSGIIGGQIGLPSPSNNSANLVFELDPKLTGSANEGSDGGTDGGTDGSTDDGGTDGSTDGGTDGSTDGGTDGSTDDGGTDGSTDGGTDGSTDGGSDGEEPVGTYLAAASSDATYECRAGDATSQTLLNAMSGGTFESLAVFPTIRREAVAPSPGPGESFGAQFSMRLALPADLVDGVVGLGINQVGLTNLSWTITPLAGVSGAALVAKPAAQTIGLVAGTPAVGQLGPVSGSFTRTSAIGEPVSFRSDGLTLAIQVDGLPEVKLACDPTAGNVLTASDQEGTPPPPPPPPPPVNPPPTTTPTTAAPGPGGGGPGGGAATGTHLPETTSQATYACSITDPSVKSMIETLTGAPVDSLTVNPTLRMAAVSPSPQQGETFTASFSARLTLPSDIVDQVVGLGITEASISGLEWTIRPEAGVTGDPVVARPPTKSVSLAAGQSAGGDFGPFSGTFTRTSAIGEPVSFRFDALSVTIGVAAFGQNLAVPLACTPTAGNVLSAVDQAGTAVLGRSVLPATGAGGATQQLIVLAILLLAAGFVLTGADAPVRVRRRT